MGRVWNRDLLRPTTALVWNRVSRDTPVTSCDLCTLGLLTTATVDPSQPLAYWDKVCMYVCAYICMCVVVHSFVTSLAPPTFPWNYSLADRGDEAHPSHDL